MLSHGPIFRKFLDVLIGEYDVGSKIVQILDMEGYTTQLMVCMCVCVCESGGLKKVLIFGIKCFSKAISLYFLFAPILLFQHVYKYHGLLCYIDHLVTQISCARQNAMTGGI